MTPETYASAKQAWLHLLESLDKPDNAYIDHEGRSCKEMVNRCITIENPSDAIDIIRELQRQPHWVYPTPEELRSIMLNTRSGTHEYAYAHRLFGVHQQVDGFIIPLLRVQPHTRRAIAMLYDPHTDSRISASHVPSFLTMHFRLLEKLEMTCHIRSCNIFLGFPANLYQLRCVHEYVAEKLGVEAGAMHCIISSAFFFTENEPLLPSVAKVIKKER